MKIDYDLLLEQYKSLLFILQFDDREVSKEVIQVIYDEIEDIQIILGKASPLQPKINGCNGYIIDSF